MLGSVGIMSMIMVMLMVMGGLVGCQKTGPEFSEATYERYPQVRPEPSAADRMFKNTGEFIGDVVAAPGRLVEAAWPFKPKPEIVASSIVVKRYTVKSNSKRSVVRTGEQTMTLDLNTGRASIVDVDGRTYPHQVAVPVATELKDALRDRAWQVGKMGAAKGSQKPVYYELLVDAENVEANDAPKPVSWAVPVPKKKTLPDSLAMVMQAFDRAHRVIYPLSDDVDLLSE